MPQVECPTCVVQINPVAGVNVLGVPDHCPYCGATIPPPRCPQCHRLLPDVPTDSGGGGDTGTVTPPEPTHLVHDADQVIEDGTMLWILKHCPTSPTGTRVVDARVYGPETDPGTVP